MNHREIKGQIFSWVIKVYRDVDSGFYPEFSSELQAIVFINKMLEAKEEKSFWQNFKNILGSIYDLVQNEPVSSKENKKKAMNLNLLLPILKKAAKSKPELKELIDLLEKDFPEAEEFYSLVQKIKV